MNRVPLINFTVAWSSQTVTAMMMFAVPSLAPLLRTALGISRTDIGTIVGISYVGVCTTSIIFGMYSDRLGIRRVLFAAHMVQSLSLIAASFASSYVEVAFAFFGVGVGYSAITPITSKIIIDWFPVRQRGSVMGFKQTGVVVGGILAGILFPLVGVLYNFHISFVFGAILVIIGAVVLLLYKEKQDSTANSNKLSFQLIRNAIANKRIVSVGLMGILFAAVQGATIGYTTLYLKDTMNLDPVLAGLVLSFVNVTGAFGRPFFGAMSDRFLNGNRVQTLFLIALTSSISLIALSQLSNQTSLWLLLVVMAFLGFGALGWNAVFLTYVGEISTQGSEAIGTSTAFAIAMIGQVIGAPLFGVIVDSSLGYSAGWEIYSLGLFLSSLTFLYFSGREIRGKETEAQPGPNV